jgi:hypothetical protein
MTYSSALSRPPQQQDSQGWCRVPTIFLGSPGETAWTVSPWIDRFTKLCRRLALRFLAAAFRLRALEP